MLKSFLDKRRLEGYTTGNLLSLFLVQVVLFSLFSAMLVFTVAMSPEADTLIGVIARQGVFASAAFYAANAILFIILFLNEASPKRDTALKVSLRGFLIIFIFQIACIILSSQTI